VKVFPELFQVFRCLTPAEEQEIPQEEEIGDLNVMGTLPSEKQLNAFAIQQFDLRYHEELEKYIPVEGMLLVFCPLFIFETMSMTL
jgi:hypothetical protein